MKDSKNERRNATLKDLKDLKEIDTYKGNRIFTYLWDVGREEILCLYTPDIGAGTTILYNDDFEDFEECLEYFKKEVIDYIIKLQKSSRLSRESV